jgi:hypothetical protein
MAATFEKVRLMALSMDNVELRRSFRTYASRIKNANQERGGALAAPPEEQKRPGWGEAASSFTSVYRSQQFTRGAHCMSVQNCTILK